MLARAARRGVLVSLQDLGAAGLASSTSEMASAGGVGVDVDLSAVPLREAGMEPWEIMISESQERMVAVVEPAAWPQVEAVCRRWELDGTVIGEVTPRATCARSTPASWWATSRPASSPTRPRAT